MALMKAKEQAGQGGKRGHSNMEHRAKTAEYKQAARKHRRARTWLRDGFGVGIVLLLLVGCASTPDANYNAYIEANARAQQQQAAQLASLADASHCKDDRCVENTKAFAAITAVSLGAASGGRSQIAPPPRKLTWSDHVRNVAGAAHPLGSIWAMVEGGKNNVRIAEIGAEREARRDEAWASVSTGFADAFAGAYTNQPPTTQITVGNDYVTGQIGDNAGRDQIGRDQHVGDYRVGDDVRRDTIGGDRTNTNTDFGTGNRFASPGPFDDVGNTGNRCTGIGCQTVNPPPEDEDD